MGLFGFGNKKKPKITITMKGYENGVEVPLKSEPYNPNEEKELDARIKEQDLQLKAIHVAESKFESGGDLSSILEFWESIWESGGLKFNGAKWTFRLPDLYFKMKQYDDAIRILKKIKNPIYKDRVSNYIEKAEAAKKKIKK